jgi:3D (Asp-Asp-Asp) domain-containing protein
VVIKRVLLALSLICCLGFISLGEPYTATAYCLQGRTASGIKVRKGIIAADPRIHPLGTKVTINAGTYSGTYLVADTGARIRGRRIDVWVSSHKEAMRFGKRTVYVKRQKL